jgi:hypothetical protein
VCVSLVGILLFNLCTFNHTKALRSEYAFHNVILTNYIIFLQIFVHTSLESLHEHVTKDALPKEYGGNLDSMSSYHSKLYGASTIGKTDPNYVCCACYDRNKS